MREGGREGAVMRVLKNTQQIVILLSIGNGKVLRLYLETNAALPQLAWAGESHFSVFLHSERWKTGNYSFTAVPIGGKVDFPGFLRSERRKTGN